MCLARLDVLLNALWPDLLAPLVAEVVPPYAQDVLNAYLSEREVLSIPDFITSLRIATFRFGAHCPYGTRAVRVGRPGLAANGDCVLELDIETLSSDMDITIHAGLNDLVAPLLEALHLRPEDSSYIAITVSDVRVVGTLRVRLCPGMRIAAAGFTEVPAVTLGLTLAYHNKLGFTRSLPVTALPGVEFTLRKLVQTEIAHYAIWPRFLAVDLVPPVLLGLSSAGDREPHGLLRVTLLQVKGVGLDALAKAGAEAAASGEGHAQPRPVVPYAIIQWGLESNRRRLPPAAEPLDEDGCTHWEGAPTAAGDFTGVTTDCDVFSVLGLDFFTVTLHAPGYGRLGAAQVKMQTMSTGETLFSFADTASDAYTPLPRVIFGAAQADYQARFDPLLPGRSTAPGVSFGGQLGVMQAWVPLDGQPGAAVHLRLPPLTPPTPPPRQGMFLVLVTNKQSNILEDLDTLRLMSKVVPEYCGVRQRHDNSWRAHQSPLSLTRGAPRRWLTRTACAATRSSSSSRLTRCAALSEDSTHPHAHPVCRLPATLTCLPCRSSRWATRRM